jgi:hypothetical protein
VIVRRLCAAAIALLALAPVETSAETAPSPATLRAALADPVDSGFLEAEVGTQGTLEGPFDAAAYLDYYRASGMSEADLQRAQTYLQRDGFAGGYGREWYRPGEGDYLGELIMVFRSSAGALAAEQASELRYKADKGFRSSVDSRLPKPSFACNLVSSSVDWTVVMFAKGNALIAVTRGSDSEYMTSGALAQAQRAYEVAPASVALPREPSARSGLAQYARLALIGALMLLLVGVTIFAVAVFLLRAPKPARAAPVESQFKP